MPRICADTGLFFLYTDGCLHLFFVGLQREKLLMKKNEWYLNM